MYSAALSLGLCLIAFSQSSSLSGLNGLGASTLTCIDRDGDGYGTGAGCLGPDADDLDPAVHTGAQALAKYGTLSAYLAHLGYSPLRIWYIATTGNDATCMTGTYPNGVPVGVGSPCLNATLPLQNLKAGDMVIYRAGTYTAAAQQFAPVTDGTSTNPIIVMAYPGESVTIDTSVNSNPAISILDRSWYVFDGFKVTAGLNGGCISGGTSSWTVSSNTFHDITVRHVEMYNCLWGYIAAGFDNLLLEDSVGHDNIAGGGQHAVYWGAKGTPMSSNSTIRRVIAYRNGWNGFHINGNIANLTMEQNIAYSNGIANFDWQNGVHNSFFRSNLSFQGGSSGGLILSVYPGTEGMSTGCGPTETDPCVCTPTPNLYSICAHDQTNNVIENFTSYQGQYAYDGSNAGPSAIWVARQATCTTTACLAANQGNNTFRNIIGVVYSAAGTAYPPINFYDPADTQPASWAQSSTFNSIVGYQSDSNHRTEVFRYLDTAYNCSSPPPGVTLTNCVNADPQFTAANPGWYLTPGSFDFHLQSGSPALHSGTGVGVPAYDLFGNPFAGTPSMGAIELAGAPPVPPPTVSITAPAGGSTVSGSVTASATATASGSFSVTGVQFQVDGTNLGSSVTVGPAYGTSWDTTKTANGLHTLTAIATDSGGRSGSASISVTINNVSSSGPVISGVTAGSITSSAATITWITDRASDSQLKYGPTAAYGLTSGLAASLVTSHVVALSGLSASTTYHFAVLSRDGSGNLSTSGDFTFSTAGSSSLGWTDLANTRLKDVCPPNSFNGIAYNFADRCDAVVSAWSSAVADTKRNRLIIWGGGHTDYSGNEVYSLNLGSSPPTLTRLTNPSDFTQNGSGCPDTNVVDGTPVARHTYDGLVYLPVQDKLFSFAGGLAPCGGPWSDRTYTLDLSQTVPTWKAMDPINGFHIGYQETTAICAYDPNTLTVICNSTGVFFRYDPATNTNTQLSTGQYPPYSATGVIDPKRKLFIFMGTDYQSTTPRVVVVDISSGSSFNAQDWSSSVTGCDTLAGSNYPGLAYDPVLDRIVGWPNAGNTIYVFNPDLKTCTAQAFPNGPTNGLDSTTGTSGRFQYFPGLNAYGIVSLATLDAFKLTLGTTPPAPIPCDVNSDGLVNAADVPAAISQVLGTTTCGTAALRLPGQCTVVDVQRVINTVYAGAACKTGN
jgi:hypothetical protein